MNPFEFAIRVNTFVNSQAPVVPLDMSLSGLSERIFFHVVVSKNIPSPPPPHHPTEGTFAKDPLPPPEISIPGGACHTPYRGISVIIQLVWVPSGKNICVKNIVATTYIILLYYFAKDNFFLR